VSSTLSRVLSNRSAAYVETGMWINALEDAQRCVEMDSMWAKAYYRLGVALKLAGLYAESQQAIDLGMSILLEEIHTGSSPSTVATSNRSDMERLIRELEYCASVVEEQDAVYSKDVVYRRFSDHLQHHGSTFPYIYMKPIGEGHRGVYAKSHLPPNSVIMKIPQSLLITVEMGETCPVGIAMKRGSAKLISYKHCCLAVYLIWDRATNPESTHRPYYQILPDNLSNMPVFWSHEDLELLAGSYILVQIDDRKANIEFDYREILRCYPEFDQLASLEDFTAARMIVASRNFSIAIGTQKTDALVPYADMLNHKRPRHTMWDFDNSIQAFTITTLTRIDPGEEIFDSYGRKCNSRYLLNYGFTVEDNKDPDGTCYNECCFWMDLSPTDSAMSRKFSLLPADIQESGLTGRPVRLSMHFDDNSTLNAFCFARYICAQGGDIDRLPATLPDAITGFCFAENNSSAIFIRPLSPYNELAVLDLIKDKAREQLDCYQTTLEEDRARLTEFSPYSKEWNACNLLISEKEVNLVLL